MQNGNNHVVAKVKSFKPITAVKNGAQVSDENGGTAGNDPAPEGVRGSLDILTLQDVAHELHCSKSHISKAVKGQLPGVTPLPAIPLGRRRLVRRGALLKWIVENEHAMLAESPKHDAVNA